MSPTPPGIHRRAAGVLSVAAVVVALGCLQGEADGSGVPATDGVAPVAGHWPESDWEAFASRVRSGLEQGWDTLTMGGAMAEVGRTFVGTPYVPGTLERPGPETLVVNFRELDCVTFVETVLATARFLKEPDAGEVLDRRGDAEARYEEILTRVRYRDGVLDGYPSRLHYFSDWIADGQAKGLVREITPSLTGAVLDDAPVDFMTAHPDAYRQLGASRDVLEAIGLTEHRLTRQGRWVLPEERIAAVAGDIRDGDVIAATSTVPGLDVAHTGLALWVDGALHLMHAPLVGDSVEISKEPLARRVRRISGQDGIMVARPCPMEGPC